MASAVIDSCCLIDVLASGHAEAILRAAGYQWHLPIAVHSEVRYIRQPDPADSSKFIAAPVDLSEMISTSLLAPCQPEIQTELDLYATYVAQFGAEGEAMCLALARNRNWVMATDDKEAIAAGRLAGPIVVSSPLLLKTWSETEEEATVVEALRGIELNARFRPSPAMAEYQWWLDRKSS